MRDCHRYFTGIIDNPLCLKNLEIPRSVNGDLRKAKMQATGQKRETQNEKCKNKSEKLIRESNNKLTQTKIIVIKGYK